MYVNRFGDRLVINIEVGQSAPVCVRAVDVRQS